MSDLVERLRQIAKDSRLCHQVTVADDLREAADEIERLTAERDKWVQDWHEEATKAAAYKAEVEALRSALRMVGLLHQLGGMMPGSREVVQTVIDAADVALRGKEAK
jgi:uncharacterized protein (UPF0335 family)